MTTPTEATHLGKPTPFPDAYDPGVLVGVDRAENRRLYDIPLAPLPFVGVDAWHCYEAGFLTDRGLPVTGVLKLVVPSDSPKLVESKSLKLYLGSFNMERLGPTPQDAARRFVDAVCADVGAVVGAPVEAHLFSSPPAASWPREQFADSLLLESMPEAATVRFDARAEDPDVLVAGPGGDLRVCTHVLRSVCKVTGQPDWASASIAMQGDRLPTPLSLLRYLVSLRAEAHFHEEVCELIYWRLHTRFSPRWLRVTCLYTRRGGIDICPSRASSQALLSPDLVAAARPTPRHVRQ